jgi:hypothetical protein
LADVDDEERDVHIAVGHLGQIDLRGQALGVVALGGETGRVDVIVRVQFEDALVNLFALARRAASLDCAGLVETDS